MGRFLATMALLVGVQVAAALGQPRATAAEGSSDDPAYRLGPNDVVRIIVFGEDELATVARVGKDGAIDFPMLGRARIGGQTIDEARGTLERLLSEYLVKPQVSAAIVGYSKRSFTILGQVNKPGTFSLPDEEPVDLLEAIGMAGGYTRIANPSKVTLKRRVDGKETTLNLDAKSMAKESSAQRIEVLPGDTIIVGESIF